MNYTDGLDLKSAKNNNKINKEQILIDEEEIILIISKENPIPDNSRIEYAMVATECDYNNIGLYSYTNQQFCASCEDEKDIEKDLFIGRTSYCNIITYSQTIIEDCVGNCATCFENDQSFCVTCKYEYNLDKDGKTKICLDKGVSPNNNKNKEKTCTDEKILENKCQDNIIENNQIEDIKNKIVNLNNTKNNTIIFTKNVNIQFCNIDIQKEERNYGLSNIDLGECEDILKKIYHLEGESLIIFKKDMKIEDYQTSMSTFSAK